MTTAQIEDNVETTVRVYRFDIQPQWLRNMPEVVKQQLRLAHDLREELVRLSLEFEDAMAETWNRFPEIKELNTQLDALFKDLDDVYEKKMQLRVKQRTRNTKGDEHDDLTAQADALKKQITQVRNQIKTLKASYKKDPDLQALHRQMRTEHRKHLKNDTYDKFCKQDSLHYDTHYYVYSNHLQAVQRIIQSRMNGQAAQFRPHSFDGTGTLNIFVSEPKNTSKYPTRSLAMISDYNGPAKNKFVLELTDEDTFESWSNAQRKQKRRRNARFCFVPPKKSDTPVLDVPVYVHRGIPAEAEITSAAITVTRCGHKLRGALNITVKLPKPKPVDIVTRGFVHFGWRRETIDDLQITGKRARYMNSLSEDTSSNALRILTWRSEQPLESWNSIKGNPHYVNLNQCMRVAEDKKSGIVFIPNYWSAFYRSKEEWASAMDIRTNEIRDSLIKWVKSLESAGIKIDHPMYKDEDGNPEPISSDRIALWKSPKQFIRLALGWRDPQNRPDVPGINVTVDELEAYRKWHKTTFNAWHNSHRKVEKRRNMLFSEVAAFLADEFDEIVMDDPNYAKIAQNTANTVELPKSITQMFNRQRTVASVGTLREKIMQASAKVGSTVTPIATEDLSVVHFECGTKNVRDFFRVTIDCVNEECKQTYDTDENALNVMQDRFYAKQASSKKN